MSELPPHCDLDWFSDMAKKMKDIYVLVGSDSCQPCHELREEIERVEDNIPHKVVVVNADECPNIAATYGVDVYPTVLYFKKGKVKSRHEGMSDKVVKAMLKGK